MKSQKGFSLIEILVVLVIMALLIGVVAPNVLGYAEEARVKRVEADIARIGQALEAYHLNNFQFPTTEQGLVALVEASTLEPEPRNFKKGGYLKEVPIDPWGREYLYMSPGEYGQYDIYSLGADGLPGCDEHNADIGNWGSDANG